MTNHSALLATKVAFPKVYGASKWEQPLLQAPSAVTVVTRDEIQKYGHRTLSDILRTLSGFHVSYDRNHSYLGARGFSRADFNNRVLVLVDGHRVNDNVSDGAFIGTEFPLDIDLIDRVEVIRGPGSVLYGNNAFFGVINVVTRLGGDFQRNGLETSAEAGSYDTYKGRLSYGRLFQNGLELLLSGSVYDSQGPERLFYPDFNTPNQNNGIAQGRDADQFGSFFSSLSYRDFTLQGSFLHREKVDPTAPIGIVFNDPRSRSSYDRSYVAFKFSHEFPDVVDVMARMYYDRNDLKAVYPSPGLLSTEFQVGERWGSELQLARTLWNDRIAVSAGAEYRDDFRQELYFELDPGPVVSPVRAGGSHSYGFYIHSDTELHRKLHLSAGIRYDEVRGIGSSDSPRAALIYNPVETSAIKAIYGTAFRAPSLFELSLARPGGINHETITSYELVYEQQVGERLRGTVSGFFNQMDDLIEFKKEAFQNVSKVEAQGLELGLEGHWANGLRGRLSYTFQETDDRTTGDPIPDSPKHLGKANLTVPLYLDRVLAGLEFQYTSRRETWRNKDREVAGFGVVNFTLFSQNLLKGLEFSGSVYNFLDREYRDPATPRHFQDWFEQNGRTFRVKLTYAF
ncbi:MAG: TonB-dependent receptor [Verrucomicrobia bacterium]|nr:TonB-dependent receptor [Verrucomicrobiota bacterium]